MSFGIVAAIGGAVIGAGATRAAAKSSNKAITNAANAETAAATANIQAAERERARNEALFAPYMDDENQARAFAEALAFGEGVYTPAGATQPVTVTRAEVEQAIAGTPLARLAEESYAARAGLADDTYAGALGLAQGEYDDFLGVSEDNYVDATTLAGQARTGRRGVAQENLDRRLSLEDQSYAAWLPISEQAERDAIDLNFSRGGVTGLVGQTREGVGQTTQAAAMERNLRHLTGRQAAHEPYYADVTSAEDAYWGGMGRATETRGDARTYATGLRSQRTTDAYTQRQGARGAAIDHRAGDRAISYADYSDFLQGRQSQGERARQNIASGGQATLGITTNQTTNAGRAQGEAAYARGAVQQQLYGDLARIAGDAYGAVIRNRKPQTVNA